MRPYWAAGTHEGPSNELLANLLATRGFGALHSGRHIRARKKTYLGPRHERRSTCVLCWEGDWKIIGFGEATSDYYVDDEQVFMKKG